MGVSIVIPVNNNKTVVPLLWDILYYGIKDIIVLNNSGTLLKFDGIKEISVKYFSHSKTRNLGIEYAKEDYVLFLSQDVRLKFNPSVFEKYMEENCIDALSFRQIPYKNAHPLIKRRVENTPFYQSSIIPLNKNSIVFSNVCAMYKKDKLKDLPFHGEYAEDKNWAKDALKKGFSIWFYGKSYVIHSHKLSLKEAYKRTKLDRYQRIKNPITFLKRFLLRIKGDYRYLFRRSFDISFYLDAIFLSFFETMGEI